MTAQRKTRHIRSIGQLLIVGFDGTEMTPRLRSLLKQLQPAGVILFARNIKTAEQTWQLLRDCQAVSYTHLDVYKRQTQERVMGSLRSSMY